MDRRKSEVETKLDPVTFAATEGQIAAKIRWMKERAVETGLGIYIVVNLMFDIARYSNQFGISVGGLSIAANIILGIAGSNLDLLKVVLEKEFHTYSPNGGFSW